MSSRSGKLLCRRNRFVVEVEIDGIATTASLPNPGRMQELLFPGSELLVTPARSAEATHPWRVLAVVRGEPIFLDTGATNRIAESALARGRVPALNSYHVVRREVMCGHSRFDLLLRHRETGVERFCEVKSCTLFNESTAMFPDAVTERGRRHVEELAAIGRELGVAPVVLIVVHRSGLTRFLPDFHNDPAFAEALYRARDSVEIVPVSVGWREQEGETVLPQLSIPWEEYERHGRGDCGLLVAAFAPEGAGEPGRFCLAFEECDGDLSRMQSRLVRGVSRPTTPLELLRSQRGKPVGIWPIRSCRSLQSEFAAAVAVLGGSTAAGKVHCSENPRFSRVFQEILLDFRLRRFSQSDGESA